MSDVLGAVEAALVDHFGHVPQRASVSYLGVDPIEVLRFEPVPGERAYVSLGMARHPMTNPGDTMLAADGPRAELMLYLRDPTDEWAPVWRRLALLAAAPAVEGVVYSAGMSVEIGEPLVTGSLCVGVVLADSAVATAMTPVGAVQVLETKPATSGELAWCRVRGAQALQDRWREQAVDLADLTRRPADLTSSR